MASYQFDHAHVQRTVAQMDAMLRQLQQQQNELLLLANEVGHQEGQDAQAEAVSRCAKSLHHRTEEMKQCSTALHAITNRMIRTELFELTREVFSPAQHPPGLLGDFPSFHPCAMQALSLHPGEALDFGLNFEESR